MNHNILTLIGFLYFTPSAQRYSYFGPADIFGHVSLVQYSVIIPYNKQISLKKSTVFTANHSFNDSPSGFFTDCFKPPAPRVAAPKS